MTFLTVESGDVLSTHEKDDRGQAKISQSGPDFKKSKQKIS